MTNTPILPTPTNPDTVFTHLIIAFLTPMFLATTGGDATYARAAATQTVNAYAARNPAELLPIAQVIALGLAMLSSLSLSMQDDLPVPLILRLRANAVSLSRAAEQGRRTLRTDTPACQPTADADPTAARQHEQDAIASLARAEQRLAQRLAADSKRTAPQPDPAPTTQHPEPPTQQTPQSITERDATPLAAAMTRVARECAADITNLPPAERRQATLRAAALSSVAHDLLSNPPSDRG
jgi:hypothetical protein